MLAVCDIDSFYIDVMNVENTLVDIIPRARFFFLFHFRSAGALLLLPCDCSEHRCLLLLYQRTFLRTLLSFLLFLVLYLLLKLWSTRFSS